MTKKYPNSYSDEEIAIVKNVYETVSRYNRSKESVKALQTAGFTRSKYSVCNIAHVKGFASKNKNRVSAVRENLKRGLSLKMVDVKLFDVGDMIEVKARKTRVYNAEIKPIYKDLFGTVIQETPNLIAIRFKGASGERNECINKIHIALRDVNVKLIKKAANSNVSNQFKTIN